MPSCVSTARPARTTNPPSGARRSEWLTLYEPPSTGAWSRSPDVGELDLLWGTQADARPLRSGGDDLDDHAVAAYVAKAGTEHRLTTLSDVDAAPLNDHIRTLIRTCWRLGGLSEYARLNFPAWAHPLGYRGSHPDQVARLLDDVRSPAHRPTRTPSPLPNGITSALAKHPALRPSPLALPRVYFRPGPRLLSPGGSGPLVAYLSSRKWGEAQARRIVRL
ncbi:replication initiator [Streptomyces rubiginosohelvolus]|uniref:replication initiator n=1 Tax=Streptomyces rubiginosohelvolus TaxID=67362 RepID=UPI0033F80087